MRVYDLYFDEIIEPLKEVVDNCNKITEKSVIEYLMSVRESDNTMDWEDDAHLLVEILNKNSKGSIFEWNVAPDGNGKPVDWYLHSAHTTNDGEIHFNLDFQTIDMNFGPETFKRVIEKTIQHESIHLSQRDLLGHELYEVMPSGYMKGEKIFDKTGNKQHMLNEYFSDPMEIMAHGHDLAVEIYRMSEDINVIIENHERYLKKLPTLDKHVKQGFPVEHVITKRLLEYAGKYLERMK